MAYSNEFDTGRLFINFPQNGTKKATDLSENAMKQGA